MSPSKIARSPITYHRLWCGRKRYSPWLADLDQVWKIAVRQGLAFQSEAMGGGLGPLTWIEHGERQYARSRTVVVSR